jgi:single-strand DNA-binding protein
MDRLTDLQEEDMTQLPFYGIGNLTEDPEVRVTPNGTAVANLTIATTARRYDRQAQSWVDGDTTYIKLVVWNEQAESVADSLRKGMRVIVQGRWIQHTYESKSGEKHTALEVRVDEIGPSLRWASAEVKKRERTSAPAGAEPEEEAPPF